MTIETRILSDFACPECGLVMLWTDEKDAIYCRPCRLTYQSPRVLLVPCSSLRALEILDPQRDDDGDAAGTS